MTKVSPRDVSGSFNLIFDWIFTWIKWCFDTLDSISFMGITLLDFSIWVFVLGIILPIIVTLLNAGRSASRDYFAEGDARYRSNTKSERKVNEAVNRGKVSK